jgi:hypothetical protein
MSLPAVAAEADNISGKWTRDAKEDNARHWSLTIDKDKFTFRVTDADKKTVLYAKGDVKTEKCGSFNCVVFTNIQAGSSEDELNPVDDDRHCIYTLDGNTLTLAMNFDKNRENGARVDVYMRPEK